MLDGEWWRDERVPWFTAAILGMLAGVAAKQAVTISSGGKFTWLSFLADLLVLGLVFIVVLYIHKIIPAIPMEGIAFLGAALAMWGPRGMNSLVASMRKKILKQAGINDVVEVEHVYPVQPLDQARRMRTDSNHDAYISPIEKLRDKSPVVSSLPADFLRLLAALDEKDRQALLDQHRQQQEVRDDQEDGQ